MPQAPLYSAEQPVQSGQIFAPVETHLEQVKLSLRQIVPPETELLALSVSHSMQSPGKLLRPVLTLLASGASGPITDLHIETAAVAELIHVATLLHDDVLDESDIRRGRSTVRAMWGNKVSILSGDYLLAQASLKLSKLNHCRLVSIFAMVLANLCEGEVEQIRSSYSISNNWESYFRKSICKTASLFSACCESAGVLNGLPEPQIEALRLFGEKFGIAFQIIDDLLDYTASEGQLGKPVLDDMKNGLLNAPVLLALENLEDGSAEKRELERLISHYFGDDEASSSPDRDEASYQAQIFEMFEMTSAIERTQALAGKFAAEAREAIAFLPASEFKSALIDLTRYALQRNH